MVLHFDVGQVWITSYKMFSHWNTRLKFQSDARQVGTSSYPYCLLFTPYRYWPLINQEPYFTLHRKNFPSYYNPTVKSLTIVIAVCDKLSIKSHADVACCLRYSITLGSRAMLSPIPVLHRQTNLAPQRVKNDTI